MTGIKIPIPKRSINTVRNIVIRILFLNTMLLYHIAIELQNMYTIPYGNRSNYRNSSRIMSL
jgi:hypothetical protein